MKTAYISHDDCSKHDMGMGHPECPERLSAIEDQLKTKGLITNLHSYEAPKAELEQLHRAHNVDFVKTIFDKSPQQGMVQIDADTSMNPFSLNAALRAAGSGVLATDLAMSGEVKRAFCNVRPPGHHAIKDTAMGFCIFNSIAVAALHAIEHHKLERVAIVDFDVHHGNGTEDILAKHPQVLVCSSYQHPFYPGYAAESVENQLVNVPLAAGSGGQEFRAAIEDKWLPALRNFKPQIIYVSAGFDAHADDNMSGLNFIDEDYIWVSEKITEIADEFSEGRVISMLEGGYDLASLGRSASEHVRVLMEE